MWILRGGKDEKISDHWFIFEGLTRVLSFAKEHLFPKATNTSEGKFSAGMTMLSGWVGVARIILSDFIYFRLFLFLKQRKDLIALPNQDAEREWSVREPKSSL